MQLIKILGYVKNKTGCNRSRRGLFLCAICSVEVEKDAGNGLKAKSCGCEWRKYKESKLRLHRVWIAMRSRCRNRNGQYKNYGGRGITVCNEWEEYGVFRLWTLNNGYDDELEIDRIDNNGNYSPDNCRFVTHKVNNWNKRNSRFNIEEIIELRKIYKFGGFSQKRIAEAYGMGHSHLSMILNNKLWKTDEVVNGRTF